VYPAVSAGAARTSCIAAKAHTVVAQAMMNEERDIAGRSSRERRCAPRFVWFFMDPLEHALQRAHSVSADVVIDIFLQSSAIDHWTLGLGQRQQRSAVQL
jgi:hypothetical protein